MFSVVMMMKVAVNRERKRKEGEMRNVEERPTAGKVEGTRTRRRSLRSSEPAVCRCDRPPSLSRVANVRAPPQPHTLGHITRRDLYSRLASLCEGRICSVRIRHSCIRARFDCMSLLPFLSYPRPSFEPGSFDRAFAATTCTRPYRRFRHPRDSTRAQLDGSNWTANDRTVIRTSNPLRSLSLVRHLALYSRNLRPSIYDDTLRDTFLRKPTLPLSCWRIKKSFRNQVPSRDEQQTRSRRRYSPDFFKIGPGEATRDVGDGILQRDPMRYKISR